MRQRHQHSGHLWLTAGCPCVLRRTLHLGATRPTCTTSNYQLLPPSFRRACRALLLAAHRSSAVHQGVTDFCHSAGVQSPAHLGSLPADALLLVMQHAVYPLSLWVGVDDAAWITRRAEAIRCLEAQLTAGCRPVQWPR